MKINKNEALNYLTAIKNDNTYRLLPVLLQDDVLHEVECDLIVRITPEIARTIKQKHSKHNRQISTTKVKEYADYMETGRWYLNGEALIFNHNGILENGYHRLDAVIKSNTPTKFKVTVSDDLNNIYSVYDQHNKRSLKAMLVINHHMKYYQTMSGALRLHYSYVHDMPMARMYTPFLCPDANGVKIIDLLSHYDQNPGLYDCVYINNHTNGVMTTSYWTFFKYVTQDLDKDLSEHFINCMTQPVIDSANSPINDYEHLLAVKTKLMTDDKNSKDKNYRQLSGLYKIAIIHKAWNDIRQTSGSKKKVFFDFNKEKFPKLI